MSADGAPVERLLDVETRPLLSVFVPDRLELLKGAPSVRRSHLDQFVAAVWPARAADRLAYSRVLAQRNALLGGIRAGRASRATISTWDRQLARQAIALRERPRRRGGAAGRAVRAARIHSSVSSARRASITGPARAPRTRRSSSAELQARLASDLERGFSTHGPHRDELALLRDGRELRLYGSQGEQRLALLAMLLAERTVLARERGRTPLMLLDDVMSELDSERRELLARELSSGGQSVIATTDLGHVPGSAAAGVTRLRVSPGTVLQEALAA